MKARQSRLLFSLLSLAAILAAPGALAQSKGDAHHSEQVVFSGTGFGNFNSTDTPFGFWVWCEADSANPYAGRCNGAMYFYALGITRHVSGVITEPQDSLYTMTVSSSDGAIACALSNPSPATKGPSNTVDAVCSAPSGTGASTTAVVNVTGPPTP